MNTQTRPLTESDAEIYHALRLRALKEHPTASAQPYESQASTPIGDVAHRLGETSESPHDFVLGIFSDEALVGMVGFRRERGARLQHKGGIWGMLRRGRGSGSGSRQGAHSGSHQTRLKHDRDRTD